MAAKTPHSFSVVALSRADLDIANPAQTREVIQNLRPQIVINGAAYNAVDKAENEGAADSLKINAFGVTNLAQACRDTGARLVHFSTDFVFDGHKRTPYLETDPTGPLSVYGASKLCGENVCLAMHERNVAIRVCRLFGPLRGENGAGSAAKPGGNFPSLMLRLARERGQVRVVDDQIGAPSYIPDLAVAVWQLLENLGENGGLFQISNAGETSFADYAAEIFRRARVNCEVERVSSEKYGAPAKRPLYSTFSNEKAHANGVEPLRHWSEALDEFLSEIS